MLKNYIYCTVDIATPFTPPYTSVKEEFQYLVNNTQIATQQHIPGPHYQFVHIKNTSFFSNNHTDIVQQKFSPFNYTTGGKIITLLTFNLSSALQFHLLLNPSLIKLSADRQKKYSFQLKQWLQKGIPTKKFTHQNILLSYASL